MTFLLFSVVICCVHAADFDQFKQMWLKSQRMTSCHDINLKRKFTFDSKSKTNGPIIISIHNLKSNQKYSISISKYLLSVNIVRTWLAQFMPATIRDSKWESVAVQQLPVDKFPGLAKVSRYLVEIHGFCQTVTVSQSVSINYSDNKMHCMMCHQALNWILKNDSTELRPAQQATWKS